jgi:hypothetical protein
MIWNNSIIEKVIRGYYKANLALRKTPYQYLWILGHMRSGSSVFTHILNTNSEISGYGETHVFYWKPQDLAHLLCDVKWSLRQFDMSDRYIMDKILHDMHIRDEMLLQNPLIRCIFLIRDPAETISSMVKLWGEHGDEVIQLFSVEDYVNYYCNRLKTLKHYAESVTDPRRLFFLTHAQFIHQTTDVFRALESFLELRSPLSEIYTKTPVTGQRKVGDWSGNLESGRIMRNASANRYAIREDLLEQAQAAYDDCCSFLAQRCSSIENTESLMNSQS